MAGTPSLYRPGTRVHEIASLQRKGVVVTVQGRGQFAVVWVHFDGRGIVACRPYGLALG